ncbi:prepilin-type N-terminal cleavage/methylation domain-containing protein [Candidatus Riflebacteria bacterium]
MKKKTGVTLMEIMISMVILTLGFFPIMNFFSHRVTFSRRIRIQNIALSLAKNSLDFFIEDTPFQTLQFNLAIPDWDGKNVDRNGVICTEKDNQIFRVLGTAYKSSNAKIPDGGLSGEIVKRDDKQKFWLKILANPFIDSSPARNMNSELLFYTTNWDRNRLNWTPSQSRKHHVNSGSKTYLDLFRDPAYKKTRLWDGRRLNPKPNSQGLIVPFCKAMVRVRWLYGNKDLQIYLESYKANLLGRVKK